MENKNYSVRTVTEVELKDFNDKFQKLLDEESLEIQCVPIIQPTSTGVFVLAAQLIIKKKVELVPKGEGMPTPYPLKDNGKSDNEPTEEKGETPEVK